MKQVREKQVVRHCHSARVAVPYYRFHTHRWQLLREAERLAGPGPKVRGHSCGFARYAAGEWHARARSARQTLYRWREQFSYRGENPHVVLGQRMAAEYGWHTGYEWEALYQLWNEESGWEPTRHNGQGSGACGIPQSMTSCFGYDARLQIAWGLRYIQGRYGSPSRALAAKHARGWY